MESVGTTGRRKLKPDPLVRVTILSAASDIVRQEGVGSLSIASVLRRAQLGTRAFYRHFDSKDELVAALFLEMARAEMLRLRQQMDAAPDPFRAVAAWIDGRLDLAFDDEIRSDLRRMSIEAQWQMLAAPELVAAAYSEILRPLVEQLANGHELGFFCDIDPENAALSIQGVVWANVERHWLTGGGALSDLRAKVQSFCLGGLGVDRRSITALLAEAPAREKLVKYSASG